MKKTLDKKVSDQEIESQMQYISLLKDRLKFKIMMLLLIYRELNVTQISNLLSQSKATVSRHLNDMEGVIVRHREEFKDREIEGRITPKYYRIGDDFLRLIMPLETYRSIDGVEGQMRFYRELIGLLRTGVEVSKDSLDMINPMISYLESSMGDHESAKKAFDEYVLGDDGVALGMFLMSERQYRLFLSYQKEMMQKMMDSRSDEPKDSPRPYMFIGSTMNMGKMLELQSLMKEKNGKD